MTDQATRVVNVLARWCEQSPGRRFTLIRTVDGWAANLDERRSSTGATAVDALSQIATCAAFEVNEP
jgi:hypothetical protein